MSPAIRTLVTTRAITLQECPWLPQAIEKGTTLVQFTGGTYGCISPSGVAAKFSDNNHEPFFEVPLDAVIEEGGAAHV